jgi:hypothetical protein
MLTNLEVLAVTNASISGPLPPEYANFLSARQAAAKAVAVTKQAAVRGAVRVMDSKRAASLLLSGNPGNSNYLEEAGKAQRLQAVGRYKSAQHKAALAQRVADAVQAAAAASNATKGRSARGIGMLKLRQLILEGNSVSGTLPAQYAQMRELQVRIVRPGTAGGSAL